MIERVYGDGTKVKVGKEVIQGRACEDCGLQQSRNVTYMVGPR